MVYKGVKIEAVGGDKYRITWPSGVKSYAKGSIEEVKDGIDKLIVFSGSQNV